MGSDEDKLASRIITDANNDGRTTDIATEVHYNHYGSRGVVDLVQTTLHEPSERRVEEIAEDSLYPKRQIKSSLTERSLLIYEFKSAAAIQNSTGANDIVRQFNRHREYFFEGSSYHRHQYDTVRFFLVFYFDRETYDHVAENEAIYQNLAQEDETRIQFRHPDGHQPLVVFGEDGRIPFETVRGVLDVKVD